MPPTVLETFLPLAACMVRGEANLFWAMHFQRELESCFPDEVADGALEKMRQVHSEADPIRDVSDDTQKFNEDELVVWYGKGVIAGVVAALQMPTVWQCPAHSTVEENEPNSGALRESCPTCITRESMFLDLGCGNGVLSATLASAGYENVTGSDNCKGALYLAEKISARICSPDARKRISFLLDDALNSTIADSSFACIVDKGLLDSVSLETRSTGSPLGGVADECTAARELEEFCYRCLLPSGLLLLTSCTLSIEQLDVVFDGSRWTRVLDGSEWFEDLRLVALRSEKR